MRQNLFKTTVLRNYIYIPLETELLRVRELLRGVLIHILKETTKFY